MKWLKLLVLITPVPGGVGPMTTMLMEQTYQAFKRSLESEIYGSGWDLVLDYMTIDEEIKQVLLTASVWA